MSSSDCCRKCGKGNATARCGRCQTTFYCNRECQRGDWKAHKTQCFAPGATCTRCLEPATAGSMCQVPHPQHLLRDAGSMFGGGSMKQNYVCQACNQSFTQSTSVSSSTGQPDASGGVYDTPRSQLCYQGPHTVKPIPDHDERRVSNDIMTITASEDMQSEIDAIPTTMPNVRVLTITRGPFGYYDDSIKPKLCNVSMPRLESLQLMDVSFSEIQLNETLTPNLKSLEMQNTPEDCEIEVIAPNLKDVSINYYGPADDESWINDMLASATKLVSFDSYKLRVEELEFASNQLRHSKLHRAELLWNLRIYAPRLEHVNLQGCYALNQLDIVERHNVLEFPNITPSPIYVDSTNACLSDEVVEVLDTNDRVIWDGPENYDDGVGRPMDAMFAQMNQGGGFMGF